MTNRLANAAIASRFQAERQRRGVADKEEKNPDGTLTVTYAALAGDEMGISRYFSGNDGIYIFSYRVRPKLKTEERMKTWRSILSSAKLVRNPLRKKD